MRGLSQLVERNSTSAPGPQLLISKLTSAIVLHCSAFGMQMAHGNIKCQALTGSSRCAHYSKLGNAMEG